MESPLDDLAGVVQRGRDVWAVGGCPVESQEPPWLFCVLLVVESTPMSSTILPGQSYPLGATVYAIGINFCLYSKLATGVDLLLFDSQNIVAPSRVIALHPQWNRTSYYWHVFVPGLKVGQIYAYRVHGVPTRWGN